MKPKGLVISLFLSFLAYNLIIQLKNSALTTSKGHQSAQNYVFGSYLRSHKQFQIVFMSSSTAFLS